MERIIMRVLKFGGTSVATPERIKVVAGIIRSARQEGRVAVVVSALGGVTEVLLRIARMAATGSDGHRDALVELERRHLAAVDALVSPTERRAVRERVLESFVELRNLLEGVSLLKECSPRSLDGISSYGECLSVEIVAAKLRGIGVDAEACDTRGLIVTDDTFGKARVDVDESNRRLRERLERKPIQIVTGFVSSTRDGQTTTLGRGGSDYTAALLGAAIVAERVEIWTDVDGVMSADP
jgi:aspartokinase/homoserine dehydrogenase 1